MKHLLFKAADLTAIFLVPLSCGTPSDDPDNGPNELKPVTISTRAAEFVTIGNTFAMEFIDKVNADAEKDYIISPLSMQFLLGMLLNGAQGVTADEISAVLGYGKGEIAEVNNYCLSMLEQLPSLDKKTKLAIAGAIFVDKGWSLNNDYVSTVGHYYDATVSNLDFSKSKEALDTINGWASEHTNGLVPKVLDEVSTDILCYLLNALYFKSEWASKFDKKNTSDEDFKGEDGSMTKVKMMKAKATHHYCKGETFEALEMGYGNGAFTMTVLLPSKGHTVSDVISSLKKSSWEDITGRMYSDEFDVWMPKFETNFGIKLNDILSAMGMPTAFISGSADFSAMSVAASHLDFVRQDAAIKVDEQGTEAAAVSTAGIAKNAVGPTEPMEFHADHPFLYLITETSTGAVLFAGRYSAK